MIKDHIEFKVGKMAVDVNWQEDVIPCKLVRFTWENSHGEIEQETIERDELYSLLMLFGNDEQQEKLMPVRKTEMVLIERMLHIRVRKNLRAGEYLTVPYQYSITKEGYDEAVKKNPRAYRIVELLANKMNDAISTEGADIDPSR